MRLIHRRRHHTRGKAPRIAISQAEITADLQYPAGSPVARLRPKRAGARPDEQ
jgi:hypothetical protein